MPETRKVIHALRVTIAAYQEAAASVKPDFTKAKALADGAISLSDKWAHDNHPGLFHDVGFVLSRAGEDIASSIGGVAHAVGDAADHAAGKDGE